MQAPFADPLSGLELQSKILPLVGRETELQVIRLLLDTVAYDLPTGARALTISGETGVGKTRLLAEMYAQARARGFRVMEGRTFESGSMFPYLPFIEALRPVLRSTPLSDLRRYLGLDTNESIAPAGNAIEVISLVGTPMVAALARLFPELPKAIHVTIPQEALSPDQEKFRLLDAIATLLERMGTERPVLLGIDNLQWADSASLELTLYLTVRLHQSRVALVGVTRPRGMRNEPSETDDPEIAMKAAMAVTKILGDLVRQGMLLLLPLGPLSADATNAYLHALLPGTLAPSLAQRLLDRAEGNPFFLEELVRALILNRQLVLRDGVWKTTQVVDTALPSSITSAVEQRLQGLNAPCRDLLRVAALFGRTFPLDALTLALEESEEKVQALIDEATQAAIIAKSPAVGTIWDEYTDDEAADNDTLRHISTSHLAPLTYMFCQGIVREALSAEIPPQRARTLHGAIGAALEATYAQAAPAHAVELARHYVKSGDRSAALYWSLLAGEDAARQQAHREAIGHFRLVLKLLDAGVTNFDSRSRADMTPIRGPSSFPGRGVSSSPGWAATTFPSRAQLHIAIGESWFKSGELEQAANAFQQALNGVVAHAGDDEAPRSRDDGGLLAGTRSGMGTRLTETPQQPLISLLQLAQANRLLADVYRMQAKYDLALAHLQVAHTALDVESQKGEKAVSQQERSAIWFPGRSFPGGASTATLEHVNTTERILFLQAEATLAILLNQGQEAEEALWQSYQLATEIGDRGSQAFALHLVGWLRGWSEQIHEAIRLQEQAHELYVAIGDPFRAALGDQGLGIIYQALGEMERARLYTLRGFERARRYGVRRIVGWLHWNQGVMALNTGDWPNGEAHLQHALQEAATHNDVRLKPMVIQAQAELQFRRGNWREAEQLFQDGILAATNTEWFPGSIALYGHFLAVTGRRTAARAQLDRAAEHPEPPGFGGDFYIPFLAEGYLHLGVNERATTYIEDTGGEVRNDARFALEGGGSQA